jgi:hypothetical protein
MSEYVERLKNLGYQNDEANKIYWHFLRNFGRLALIEYIEKLEREEKCL